MMKKERVIISLLLGLCLVLYEQPCLAAEDETTVFDKQIIAVLENKPDLIEGAEFLYMKHPGTTNVAIWIPNEQKFYRYDIKRKFLTNEIIEKAYSGKERIQVVGHGQISEESGGGHKVKMSGFTATQLGQNLVKLVVDPKDDNTPTQLRRISLAGCKLAPDTSTRGTSEGKAKAKFLEDLCLYFMDMNVMTIVTARSELVGVSPSGQKMIGIQKDEEITWVSKEGRTKNYKFKAYVVNGEFYISKDENAKKPSKDLTKGQDMDTGIMTDELKNNGVLISYLDPDLKVTKAERVKYDVAYSLVDHAAGKIYDSLDHTSEPKTKTVVIRSNDIIDSGNTYWAREVREITGTPDEFMKELKRQAENYKNGGWDQIPNPQHNDYLYYRYGDWVYRMTKHNLYMKLQGVVASEITPPGFENPNQEIDKRALDIALNKELVNENVGMENVPDDYPTMNKKLSNNFMEGARNWMYGNNDQLQMPANNNDQIKQSYDGQMTIAMFLSESVRNFRNHPTNVMGLDMAEKQFLTRKQFYDDHPMAKGGTWQEKIGPRKKVGMEPEGLRILNGIEQGIGPKQRMTRFTGTWLSRMKASCNNNGAFEPGGKSSLLGSFNKPGWNSVKEREITSLDQSFRTLRNNLQDRMHKLDHTGDFTRYNSKLLTDEPVYVAETKATTNGIELDHEFNDEIAPSKFSSYLAIDQDFINNKIAKEVQLIKDQHPDKEVEIDLKSIKVQENEVSFDVVWDKSAYPPSEGRSQANVEIEEVELLAKQKLDEFHERTKELSEEGALSEVSKGLSIYGTVMGLKSSIQALQRGDIPHGMVSLSQSMHGIGELTGINRKIYSAGKKLLGNVLDKGVSGLENTVLKGLSSEVRSSITEFEELIEDVPIVGTAFGIYNIVEDFQQHTTLGYIDADLDIAITGLSFLGPEADIVTVPLTIIRMSIDELFGNIHINKSLPIDGQIRQFFEQFGRNILHWFETFSPIVNIINTIFECKKLDAEYDKEQDFLNELEDYHNYYDVVNDGSTIDFTDGVDTQYGGSIVFKLGENGQAEFSYVADIVDGQPRRKTRHITLEPFVTDIVLGMGETLKITTKEDSVKLFGLITVDSHRIIHDTIQDKNSLHGTYHGNNNNNNFYCVQDQPPGLPYNLSEYNYEVYGHGGDDKFMLGPQHTYVEGGTGADTLYIHKRGSLVAINNYAKDMITDYTALYANYADLKFHRDELDLVIYITSSDPSASSAFNCTSGLFSSVFTEMFGTSASCGGINGHSSTDVITHIIRILNWYKDVTYQHMHFSTMDGVSFRMTIDKNGLPNIAILGLDLSSREVGQEISDQPFCSVVFGSDFSDSITLNQLSNHIEGGKGDDFIQGMDGIDMYIIREGDGVDNLDNFANDNETDVLFLMASHTDLTPRADGGDLVITSSSGDTGVIIKKWLSGDPQYRHLQLVDKDGVVLKMPTDISDMKLTVLYLDTSLTSNTNPDLTEEDLRDVADVRLAEGWHYVIANSLDNTIYAPHGSNGIDGNFGSNTYVLGGDTRYFFNIDMSESTQLIMVNIKGEFYVRFDNNVLIGRKGSSTTFIRLHAKYAETDKIFNITTIRSYGIVFRLEQDQYSYRAKAVPIMLDLSSGEIYWPLTSFHDGEYYNIDMTLTDARRLIGPPYPVNIRCNDNGDYIDAGEGGSYILSGYSPDTFVIKPGYGTNNVIRIIDFSSKIDTLLFLVPYDDIKLSTDDTDDDTVKISFSSDSLDVVQVDVLIIKRFLLINLLVISSDGVTAKLRGTLSEGYFLDPILINRATADGQTVNLTSSDQWDSVVSFYGSKEHSNHITGNSGNNTLVGGHLADTLLGMDGDDTLKGGAGDDHLYGGDGNDLLLAGKGNDYMYGEEDQDTFIVPISGNHYVDGGNGSDTVICVTHSGCTVSLEDQLMYSSSKPGVFQVTVREVENVEGTPNGDSLEGDDNDNTLTGLGGDDLLIPMIGSDSLIGGEGSDTYYLVAGKSGFSAINNFAEDKKTDIINVVFQSEPLQNEMCEKERWRDLLMLKRVSDNLFIRWLSITDPIYYDNHNTPGVSLHNWFKGEEFQHLCLEFCGGVRLCDDDLTPPEEESIFLMPMDEQI